MKVIFAVLLFFAFVGSGGLVIGGLIKPSWVKRKDRKEVLKYYLTTTVVLFSTWVGVVFSITQKEYSQADLMTAVEKTISAVDTPTALVKENIKEVTVEVTKEVEVTREIEVPVTVTFTPGPSQTPTITPSPTITPTFTPTNTFTPTATPFSTYGCQSLRAPANYWNMSEEELAGYFEQYEDKCVKFYASDEFFVTTDYGWLAGLNRNFIFDENSPEGISSIKKYSTVWGIWGEYNNSRQPVYIRRVEPFPELKQPMEDDGSFMVGEDYNISPGQWKSLWPPGTIDDCYWERINPDTGDIKYNHFGQAGIYVRIYSGDLFNSDGCAPWVFVKP